MISIFGIPLMMDFERPLMKRVIGNKMVVWGFYVGNIFHTACFMMSPFLKIIQSLFGSGEEESAALRGLGEKDLLIGMALYMPLLVFYGSRLRILKRFLLRKILEEQSLTTAFKEVDDEPDLERAPFEVVGTEMYNVVTWIYTKTTLLFCFLGCVLMYKEYRYIPMVSLLPVDWFIMTSGSFFYTSYEMNNDTLQFATKRMEKILATNC